jgi:hypothetical protein
MADVDLSFLARQMERLIANDARQHDDITVLTAIVTRLDNSVMGWCRKCGQSMTKIARMSNDGGKS